MGGAIFNLQGTVTLENSFLISNTAAGGDDPSNSAAPGSDVGNGSGAGGGVFNYDGIVSLKHVTATGNIVSTGSDNPGQATGGAIYNYDAPGGAVPSVAIFNSILANSTFTNASGFDVVNFGAGTVTASGASNSSLVRTSSGLSGTVQTADPNLGPRESYGGRIVVKPLAGSPAINTGDNANSLTTDAIGTARPQGGIVDIGATEGAFNAGFTVTNGMVFLSDANADAVFALDPANGNRYLVSKLNLRGSGPDIGNPRGLVLDSSNNIYVVNTSLTSRSSRLTL